MDTRKDIERTIKKLERQLNHRGKRRGRPPAWEHRQKHPEFVSPWERGEIGDDEIGDDAPGVREPVGPKPPHQPPITASVPLPE
jgi:hypothetical protein